MLFKLKSLPRLLGFAALAVSVAVMSADHAESPGADADSAADLADIFLFPSPEDPLKMVAAITFGGRAAPRPRIDQPISCEPNVARNVLNVAYAFNIDRESAPGANDFDNVPEIVVLARFAKNAAGVCTLQLENVPGAGGTFSGATETVFTSPGGIRAFAGLRNDPFFFDAQGYQALIDSFPGPGASGNVQTAFGIDAAGNPTRPRRDSFASRNVSAIVFEMDLNTLSPVVGAARRTIRVWGTTARRVS